MSDSKSKSTAAQASKLVDKVAVSLSSKANPGLKACGPYVPDRIYTLPCAEAMRLVTDKGFAFNTPGDKVACEEALAAAAAAATNQSEV